ncbi:hypothetical protein BJV78DRAFT_1323137 [Lactifluus subvellereus]|nr:hypothetical protein BJV78DRAFT_1323137 [Lactifluus subvellereus]
MPLSLVSPPTAADIRSPGRSLELLQQNAAREGTREEFSGPVSESVSITDHPITFLSRATTGHPCSERLSPEWTGLPTALTPASSASSTVISFDSLGSAQANLILGPEDEGHTQPPGSTKSMNTSALPSSKPGCPYVQHKRFFLDDGNITFLGASVQVEGILYRVHRYFFCRDSNEFGERLSRLSAQQGPSSTPGPIISLDDVKSADFDTFLSVLYPLDFNMLEKRSFEEWSSILDLSTRWGFTSIRDLATWALPTLLELCERPQPLSVDEARLMNCKDIVLVGSVRESVRSHTLSVHPAEIKDCIEAWKKKEPWNPGPNADDDDKWGDWPE